MAVIRVNKTKDYTVMSNIHLKEKDMSLKAKGLLSLMLSLPEDWDYSITGLVALCKENESAIKSTLKELKEFGYLKINKIMPNESKSGRIEYIYDIFEFPKQEGEKQGVENQPLEFLPLENPGQQNTNNKNTNKLNIKYNKEKDKKENIIADIIGLYNEICVSLPKVKTVSNARKTAIKSLVNKYDIEQIRTVFTKAETSNFLKGNNNHSWQANFDWLIKDSNFAKVLDGNYDRSVHTEKSDFASYDIDLFEQMLNKED